MKNLKKLISVVLTIAMMASFFVVGTSAASYPDVETTKGYYAAVELLSALDILKGDENGNFNPDAEIKRSEFAAVICRALGQESAATSLTSKFDDVAPSHWAVGYIGWAAGKGIVNGYGDGTFAPDKAVSYQEAVKMIMAALGYTALAENKGGYPYGYLALAGTYGVTAGVSADPAVAAPRSLVAQLVYNALEAPLMDSSYFSTTEERFVIYDGSKAADYEERTILSQYLDIISVRAKVVANYKTDANKYVAKDGRQLVKLDNVKYNNKSEKELAEDGEIIINNVFVGETAAADFLTKTVDAYVYFNEDDEAVLKAIVESKKATTSVTVEKDIEEAYVEDDAVVFTYWEDIENDTKATELEIDAEALVYVNSALVGAVTEDGRDAFEALAEDFAGKVEFIGAKGEAIDSIFITVYDYAMVEAVNAEDEAIELTDGYIELGEDFRDKGFVYNVYKDGEEIALDDIKEGDVLTLVYPGDDRDAAANMDIYVSSASVTGVITKADGDLFYIDGEGYAALTDVAVGDEGIFFLTHDGKIVASKATSSISDNYALVIKTAENEVFGDTTYQVKLFTKEGKTATYAIASTVAITEEGETTKIKASKDEEAMAEYFAAETGLLNEAGLITFEVNSDDEINKISFAWEDGKDGEDFNVNEVEGAIYKPSTGKFDKYYFGDETVVFYAPADGDDEDYAIITAAALDENLTYDASVYATDNKVMGAVVITSDLGFAGKANAVAVVTNIAVGLNAEGDKATTITVFQSGAKETYVLDEEVEEPEVGNIIQFVVNAAGEISQAEIVWDGALTAYADEVTADESDITFIENYVVDYEKGAYVLDADYDDAEGEEYIFNYEEGCTLAMVTEAKAGTNSYVTKVSSTTGFKYTNTKSSAPVVYYMVARLVDGEIVDAVEFNLGSAE